MADVVPTTRKQALQMAAIIAGAALTFNVVFWVMSGMYFSDKPKQLGSLPDVRAAFAVLSLTVAAMSFAAGLAPRWVGHGLARAIGIAALVGGSMAVKSNLPIVMGFTLVITGLVISVLTQYSWRYSRAAWSFLIAMLAVIATVTFFGAPKIRHVLGIGLWYVLIIPALQLVAVTALSMVRDEYKNR